jgi:hypothetical protein
MLQPLKTSFLHAAYAPRTEGRESRRRRRRLARALPSGPFPTPRMGMRCFNIITLYSDPVQEVQLYNVNRLQVRTYITIYVK